MNYENELETVLSELDVSELDGLINDIELPHNRMAGKIIAEKTARKERITMSKSIKKRTAAGIVAAVAALGCTIAAGAYVYDHFAHQKQNISELTGDSQYAEELESKGLLDDEKVKVDHFIVSKDTKAVFDGSFIKLALTITPVDKTGQVIALDKSEQRFIIEVDRNTVPKDKNGNPITKGEGYSPNINNDYHGIMVYIPLSCYCESFPLTLNIKLIGSQKTIATLKYDLTPNVEHKQYISADGKRINLSEMSMASMDNVEFYARHIDDLDPNREEKYRDEILFSFVMKDGTQKDFKKNDVGASGGGSHETLDKDIYRSYTAFRQLIDINEVSAIIIDGERFEPEK